MSSALSPIDLAPVPRLALRRVEAAEALGISDRTLWTWTRDGDVPHVRIGGTVLYPVAELAEWLAARADGTGTATAADAARNEKAGAADRAGES